jgi:LuxR family quorum-sensing system transcriptional regulator SolR
MIGCISIESTPALANCMTQLHAKAERLEFEFSGFGSCSPVPVMRPERRLYTNFPAAWQQHYQQSRYIDTDPTLNYGLRSSRPGIWSDEFFASATRLWQEAQLHGLRHGIVIPRHKPGGAYSVLILARSHTPITFSELESKEFGLQALAQWADTNIRLSDKSNGVAAQSDVSLSDVSLSEREVEVLRWTADGKTAADIAGFLGVSERTVNFSITAASCKLNACNKTSATVRAALLGLLW